MELLDLIRALLAQVLAHPWAALLGFSVAVTALALGILPALAWEERARRRANRRKYRD